MSFKNNLSQKIKFKQYSLSEHLENEHSVPEYFGKIMFLKNVHPPSPKFRLNFLSSKEKSTLILRTTLNYGVIVFLLKDF